LRENVKGREHFLSLNRHAEDTGPVLLVLQLREMEVDVVVSIWQVEFVPDLSRPENDLSKADNMSERGKLMTQ
jgi:hypothetical protein